MATASGFDETAVPGRSVDAARTPERAILRKSKIEPTALIICDRWECDLQGGVAGAVSLLARLLQAIGMVVYCTLLKTNPTIDKEANDIGINLCLPSKDFNEENIKPDPSWLETHEDFYPDIQQINDVALVIGFGLITSRAARQIKNLFQNALFQVVNLWSHDLISERTLGYSVQKFRTQSVFLEKDCKEAHSITSIGSNAFEYFHQAFINCNTSSQKHFKIFPVPGDKYFKLSAPTAKQNGLVHIMSFLEEHEAEDLTGLLYLAEAMAEVTECFVKMFSKPPKWKVLGVPPGKESAIQQRLATHRKLEVTCCPITSLKQFECELQSSHLVLIPPKSVNTLDLALTSMAIGIPVVAPSGSPCHIFVEEFMEEFETDIVVDMNGDITDLRKKIIYTIRKHGPVCRKMEIIKNFLKGVVPKLLEANLVFVKCVAEHLKTLYQDQYDLQNLRFSLPDATSLDEQNNAESPITETGQISQEAEDSSSNSDDSQTSNSTLSSGKISTSTESSGLERNEYELRVKLGINGAIPVKGKSIKDVERALFRRKIQKKIKSLTAKLKTVRKHSSKKIAKIETELEKLHKDLEFIDDTPSSISFIMKCKSLEALECLMSEYSSGRLLKMMEEELLTPEFMKRIGVMYLSLQVLIDMEEYKLCRHELLALSEPQTKKPRRNSISSVYEIKSRKPARTARSSASEHLHLIVPDQIQGQITGHSLKGSTGIACVQNVTAVLQRRTGIRVFVRRYQQLKEEKYRLDGKVMILRGMMTDRIDIRQACGNRRHQDSAIRESREQSLLLYKMQLTQEVREGRKLSKLIGELYHQITQLSHFLNGKDKQLAQLAQLQSQLDQVKRGIVPKYTVRRLSRRGNGPGEVWNPWGLTINQNRQVVVSDYGDEDSAQPGSVKTVTADTAQIISTITFHGLPNIFRPTDVKMPDKNLYYIADEDNECILVCDAKSRLKQIIDIGEVKWPEICLGPDSTVFVADDNGRVIKYSKAGAMISSKQLSSPWYLTMNSKYQLIVSCFDEHCIYVLDSNLNTLHTFGHEHLVNPWGVSVDAIGENIYVADENKVKIFSAQGEYLTDVTVDGEPTFIAVFADGRIVYKDYSDDTVRVIYT